MDLGQKQPLQSGTLSHGSHIPNSVKPWPRRPPITSWPLVCKVGCCQAGTQIRVEEVCELGSRAGGRDEGSDVMQAGSMRLMRNSVPAQFQWGRGVLTLGSVYPKHCSANAPWA